eukprot:scaffold19771_cov60-Phaeocystis_antarctica.AAC.1
MLSGRWGGEVIVLHICARPQEAQSHRASAEGSPGCGHQKGGHQSCLTQEKSIKSCPSIAIRRGSKCFEQRWEPAIPRPQLLGTRVRVLWEDEWYHGVAGASRLEDGVWITRVAYDASGTWRKCSMWHSLANKTWEQV